MCWIPYFDLILSTHEAEFLQLVLFQLCWLFTVSQLEFDPVNWLNGSIDMNRWWSHVQRWWSGHCCGIITWLPWTRVLHFWPIRQELLLLRILCIIHFLSLLQRSVVRDWNIVGNSVKQMKLISVAKNIHRKYRLRISLYSTSELIKVYSTCSKCLSMGVFYGFVN